MATTKKSAAPKKVGVPAKKPSLQKAAAPSAAAKKAVPLSTSQSAKKSAAPKGPDSQDPAAKSPAKKTAAKVPPKTAAAKAPAKKAPAKKEPAKKEPAKKAPAKKEPAKKSSVKVAPVKKAPVKKAPAKKAPVTKAPVTKEPVKKSPAKSGAGTSDGSTPTNGPAPKGTTKPKSGPTKTRTATTKTSGAAPTGKADPQQSTGAIPLVAKKPTGYSARSGPEVFEIPAPRGTSKDGIAYTKDFDVKFLKAQWEMLLEERSRLLGQAVRLEDEAHQLIEEAEMGDVQFDDEGGEGDTMVVERERDLALSAQARETITEIDEAIARIQVGTYGYSKTSGRPIPRERLEALPWATELVSEKVGGIGRR